MFNQPFPPSSAPAVDLSHAERNGAAEARTQTATASVTASPAFMKLPVELRPQIFKGVMVNEENALVGICAGRHTFGEPRVAYFT
jgi:hypothetical protein